MNIRQSLYKYKKILKIQYKINFIKYRAVTNSRGRNVEIQILGYK